MNTSETLNKKFLSNNCKSWRTHKLEEVDISYVIWYLLKKDFVVEIDGHKYDVTFGLNKDSEIGYAICQEGSPNLTSFAIVERGFKEGKWFEILDEELSTIEKEGIKSAIKEREEKEMIEFMIERLGEDTVRNLIEGITY